MMRLAMRGTALSCLNLRSVRQCCRLLSSQSPCLNYSLPSISSSFVRHNVSPTSFGVLKLPMQDYYCIYSRLCCTDVNQTDVHQLTKFKKVKYKRKTTKRKRERRSLGRIYQPEPTPIITECSIYRSMQSLMDKLKANNVLHLAEEIRIVAMPLFATGLSSSDVAKILLDKPELLKYTPDKIESCMNLLQKYGFGASVLRSIIYRTPGIINIRESQVSGVMQTLRSYKFIDTQIIDIISQSPSLFGFSPNHVKTRFEELMNVWPHSEVRYVVHRSPKILTVDWSYIEERIAYIHEVMGLDQQHMLHPTVFQSTMLHIKSRHTFLERAGLYSKPNKHGVTRVENARIGAILGNSDATFVFEFAKLSLAEYQAFCAIMKQETAMSGEVDHSDNEESFSDDMSEEDDSDDDAN